MRAKEIGTLRVIQASPSQSLRHAAETMRKHQVGCLVVVADGLTPRPIGMITDRDLVTSALALGRDLDVLTVGEVMSRPPVICRDDNTLVELAAIMRGSGVRRLPIVNACGSLVGVVSADDLVVAIAELMESLARALIVDPQMDHVCT